jgi:predicted GTPase
LRQLHREQEAAADAANEKVFQEIVEGKRRGKRRDRGISLSDTDGSEDSDSDDRRHRYSKKQKIKNNDLEELGKRAPGD